MPYIAFQGFGNRTSSRISPRGLPQQQFIVRLTGRWVSDLSAAFGRPPRGFRSGNTDVFCFRGLRLGDDLLCMLGCRDVRPQKTLFCAFSTFVCPCGATMAARKRCHVVQDSRSWRVDRHRFLAHFLVLILHYLRGKIGVVCPNCRFFRDSLTLAHPSKKNKDRRHHCNFVSLARWW